MRRIVFLGLMVSGACRGGSTQAPPTALPTEAPTSDAAVRTGAPASDEIVATWNELQPRLHAVYRGRLAVEPGQVCASKLEAVTPPDAQPPARLCTPLADVLAWQIGHSIGVPSGDDLWIATTRDTAGRERVAVATAAAATTATFGARDGDALTEQYRCGQLALRWRVPIADLACTTDTDCRLFTSTCFAVAVAQRAAVPYQALHERWGGTCVDPAGGFCAPPRRGAICIEQRCSVE